MRLIPSSIVSPQRRLILLAPSRSEVPESFGYAKVERDEHARLLTRMQRLRGATYLEDGAIEAHELTSDGCHRVDIDEDSWHLLALNEAGQVCGCTRYLQHRRGVSFPELTLRNSALAQCDKWGKKLKTGIESELAYAREHDLAYVEAGGWALSEELRGTAEALRMALATFALARLLGGCLGISTATMRHCSASILQRIGGRPLQCDGLELPSYYDPQYKCEMAMVRFDSRSPNPKYEAWINDIQNHLLTIPVFCSRSTRMHWQKVLDVVRSLSETQPVSEPVQMLS
jgi:hypothetical protein